MGNSVGRKVLWVNEAFQKSQTAKFQSLEVKVSENWPIQACALYYPIWLNFHFSCNGFRHKFVFYLLLVLFVLNHLWMPS
jgi:hypothetical protein